MSRELETERKRITEKDAAISRLEGEYGAAKSRWAAASEEARRLGDQIMQLRAALDEERRGPLLQRRRLRRLEKS